MDLSNVNTKATDPGKAFETTNWTALENAFWSFVHDFQLDSLVQCHLWRYVSLWEYYISVCLRNYDSQTPLKGPFFKVVHGTIVSVMKTETCESWMKNLEKHRNGWRDMIALCTHNLGEDNEIRWKGDVKNLGDTSKQHAEHILAVNSWINSKECSQCGMYRLWL